MDESWGGNGRKRLVVAVGPTEIVGETRRPAPAGVWKIEVKSKNIIKVWIQRDDGPFLRSFNAKQSYFDDTKYQRFDNAGRVAKDDNRDSFVKRFGAMNGFASKKSRYIRVAAAHFDPTIQKKQGEVEPTDYSGAGDPDDRYRPNVSAIADRSRSMRGVVGAGAMPGSAVTINGTSVAAPQLTRILADKMANKLLHLKRSDRELVDDDPVVELGELEIESPAADNASQRRRRRRKGRGALKRGLKNLPERFFRV